MDGVNTQGSDLGAIPDQRVWYGYPLVLKFDTRRLDAGSLRYRLDPVPRGKVAFDQAGGAFHFDPAPDDGAAFAATFSATRDGVEVSQTITISPVPPLKAEREVIRGRPIAPDPRDTHYFKRTVTPRADGSEDHVISGMTLVFGGPDDRNRLHRMYHVDRSSTMPADQRHASLVGSLTLCADHLVIHDELYLPETDVRIFAREVTFEGQARIDTSPLAWQRDRARGAVETGAKGDDGAHGRKAGDMLVRFDRLDAGGELSTRFVLRGGRGQDAGEGMRWTAGTSHPSTRSRSVRYASLWPWTTKKTVTAEFDVPATYVKSSQWDGTLGRALAIKDRDLASYGAPNCRPTSATGGQAPGTPGNGGDAGQFASNRRIADGLIDRAGGACGRKAADVAAAPGGQPASWAHYELTYYYTAPDSKGSWSEVRKTAQGTTADGVAYPAPAARKETGASPEPVVNDSANAWLHPFLAQVVLRHARDMYLADRVETTGEILSVYRQAFDTDGGRTPEGAGWESDAHYEAVKAEVRTLLHRIASHRDYFGNPVGWTPLFSLQSHMRMYDDEVDAGLRTLIMTRWVRHAAEREQNALAAMDDAIANLNADTAEAGESIDAAEGVLRRVEEELTSLRTELLALQDDLERRREALRVAAANDLLMRARIDFAAQALGAVCTVVPVGQPALGVVGALAPVIARHATAADSDPIDAVGDGFQALAGWSKGAGKDTFTEWAAKVKAEAKPKGGQAASDEDDAKTRADRIAHVGKNIGPALSQIGDAFKGLKIPHSEIEAELEHLAAESPEYGELIDRIVDLNLRKAGFIRRLDDALQTLAGAYGRITANFVDIASLARQRQSTLAILDHQALLFIDDMEQRARDRLVRYQYYLLRAYEASAYRAWDDVDYRLASVFDRIAELLEKDAEGRQGTYADRYAGDGLQQRLAILRPVFRGILDEIEERLKSDFQTSYPYSREYRLSSENTPDIVARLNRDGRATFNLMDIHPQAVLIPPNKERVRLAGIGVKRIVLRAGAPDAGSVELTFRPVGDGTIRSDGRLYAFRHPAQSGQASAEERRSQLLWGTVYSLSSGAMTPIEPSKESLSLLACLIKDPAIDKDSLAKPAAWTDVEVALEKPVGTELDSVLLDLSFLFCPLAFEHHTLDIRTAGQRAPLILCDTEDVNGRSAGFGRLYRIFPRSTKVALVAPSTDGEQVFRHWAVLDCDAMSLDEIATPTFHASTDRNLRLTCVFGPPTRAAVKPAGLASRVRARAAVPSTPAGQALLVRDRPSMQQGERIGVIPAGATFTLLDGEEPVDADGCTWQKVDFRGLVGWISDATRDA
ncbi:MAG: SH3 domain-containing protein [Thauera sp.]|nr:SH3 domain-containing protein [Thauera sp.]